MFEGIVYSLINNPFFGVGIGHINPYLLYYNPDFLFIHQYYQVLRIQVLTMVYYFFNEFRNNSIIIYIKVIR